MVSAWQVYWVMQLDSIGAAFEIVAAISGIAGLFIAIAYIISLDVDETISQNIKDVALRIWTAFVVFIAISAFIPSSKTAAAMIILPAVTSDKVIDSAKGEVKELLGLTKDALRGLNPDNHKPKPAEGK